LKYGIVIYMRGKCRVSDKALSNVYIVNSDKWVSQKLPDLVDHSSEGIFKKTF